MGAFCLDLFLPGLEVSFLGGLRSGEDSSVFSAAEATVDLAFDLLRPRSDEPLPRELCSGEESSVFSDDDEMTLVLRRPLCPRWGSDGLLFLASLSDASVLLGEIAAFLAFLLS